MKYFLIVILTMTLISCKQNHKKTDIPLDRPYTTINYDDTEFIIIGPYVIPSDAYNEANNIKK
jgi:hypothetical protein